VIEPSTLSCLWKTHARRLLVIARSIGEPAEDAVQEAFTSLAVLKTLPDDPLAWLATVARNRLLQWRRSRGRREQRERLVAENRNWFIDQDNSVETKLDGEQVTQWLFEIPEKQREVIVMHLWGGMNFRQIAVVMNTSAPTANRLYHSGIEQLKAKSIMPTKTLQAEITKAETSHE
jgi:RNA polymerase sigma factor (sigma-70 family)